MTAPMTIRRCAAEGKVDAPAQEDQRLPVVDEEGALIGLISTTDIMRRHNRSTGCAFSIEHVVIASGTTRSLEGAYSLPPADLPCTANVQRPQVRSREQCSSGMCVVRVSDGNGA